MVRPYMVALPEVFPYLIRGPLHSIEGIVTMLMRGGVGCPNGSSFALTSEGPSGYRYLYLSEASYKTLLDAHIVPGLFQVEVKEEATNGSD
jgi:hypothetical protein